MSGGVSVVICCHNSAKRLPETLRNLAAQQVSKDIPWEIVVVDNASTDDTAETARRCWPTSSPAALRVASEPEAGLSHARMRGIREARHEIVSLIDDDNWVSPDWIERVNALFASHPEIGACGGKIEAVCEITPPDWFASLRAHFAIGSQHPKTGDITNRPGTLLCGAGLSLSTVAVRKLLKDGLGFILSDRKGNLLSTGGDTELCFALRAAGWRLWYDDALILRHFIPKERLQWSYALRLMRGMGGASVIFDLYLFALNQPPFTGRPAWKKSWLFDALKSLYGLACLMVFHPLACLRRPEGSAAAVDFERATGRLATLWALCGRYKKVQEDIQQSAWVKGP